MLGVTPEPTDSVSRASELVHVPCSPLSPDTGSDPPCPAGASGKAPGKGGPSPRLVRSAAWGDPAAPQASFFRIATLYAACPSTQITL